MEILEAEIDKYALNSFATRNEEIVLSSTVADFAVTDCQVGVSQQLIT